MRITTRMIYRNMSHDLNKLNSDVQTINKQISSEKQMGSISDNPANIVNVLGLRNNIATIAQYQENLSYGKTMVTAAETALSQMKDLMMQANNLTLQASNDSLSMADREIVAEEVGSLLDQAISLANTRINGKYIFGGYRTMGYTESEPAPFIADLGVGYQVNGSSMETLAAMLTGNPISGATDLNNGDLVINGVDIGAVDLDSPTLMINGLNMGGADNLKAAINASNSNVTARLTTLYYSGTAATSGTATDVSFSLNGVSIAFTASTDPGNDAVAAINAVSGQTGVTAYLGDGSNGGAVGAVVLRNSMDGDEADIAIAGYSETGGTAGTGLSDVNQTVGPTSNTGEISLTSAESFVIGSNNYTDDTVRDIIGLGGGNIGFNDEGGDGTLIYGYRLDEDELLINNAEIGAPTADAHSTIFADTSASAKAAAINAYTETTGVHAEITPASIRTHFPVTGGTLSSGDLIINGVDIFSSSTTILVNDDDNALIEAINNQSGQTGVTASRDSGGKLILSAIDGRNIQIETSAVGESVTHLNGADPATPQDMVYFGSVLLYSEAPFTLQDETSASGALAALGLDGGAEITGQPNDYAGDGILHVDTALEQEGNVRYVGDTSDLRIKIGRSSNLTIAVNGQEAVADTGIFTVLSSLQQALLGENYTMVTGVATANDTTSILSEGATGLEGDETEFTDGHFTVTVYDKAYSPPRELSLEIPVDTQYDTLDSIADKINGITGITAYWDNDGSLNIASDDTNRYSFSFSEDTTNFLQLAGITDEIMQSQALEESLVDIQQCMEEITSQVSSCGTTYNRIELQSQIYDDLELAIQENLSNKEDTDLVEAAMQLSAKSTAYEAALTAAAKVMKLNLFDYL
ncbi:MAG: hypothetical protein HY885_11375 [Deltaproteobacteria bacterium]|nr:hypothetical protein [Deltaproteobacteria bacterium]